MSGQVVFCTVTAGDEYRETLPLCLPSPHVLISFEQIGVLYSWHTVVRFTDTETPRKEARINNLHRFWFIFFTKLCGGSDNIKEFPSILLIQAIYH
jgi:hypothetical protein